jgi:hypothetical protein
MAQIQVPMRIVAIEACARVWWTARQLGSGLRVKVGEVGDAQRQPWRAS